MEELPMQLEPRDRYTVSIPREGGRGLLAQGSRTLEDAAHKVLTRKLRPHNSEANDYNKRGNRRGNACRLLGITHSQHVPDFLSDISIASQNGTVYVVGFQDDLKSAMSCETGMSYSIYQAISRLPLLLQREGNLGTSSSIRYSSRCWTLFPPLVSVSAIRIRDFRRAGKEDVHRKPGYTAEFAGIYIRGRKRSQIPVSLCGCRAFVTTTRASFLWDTIPQRRREGKIQGKEKIGS
ncbi:uncharacterized protein LOC143181445 [Calliopsis andreniformis]|uniref:uncharacterized protein LOC143181445 n=1 Tax=Calliopsis andreniformis TaxID=337506 RepID=UPI003FCDF37A